MTECMEQGCGREARTRVQCSMHYQRLWKLGKTEDLPRTYAKRLPHCTVEGCLEKSAHKDYADTTGTSPTRMRYASTQSDTGNAGPNLDVVVEHTSANTTNSIQKKYAHGHTKEENSKQQACNTLEQTKYTSTT